MDKMNSTSALVSHQMKLT